MKFQLLSAFVLLVGLSACKKDETPPSTTTEPKLIFVFDFDSTQVRLNNIGQPATMPAGNAGQSPKINAMTAHYIELAPTALTQVGQGAILYHAPETSVGGSVAIDFSKAKLTAKGEKLFEIPLKQVAAGEYEFLRVSVGYQNFDVKLHIDTTINIPGQGNVPFVQDFPATVASFVGYNSYILDLLIKTETVAVNANKLQGFWGFEMKGSFNGFPISEIRTGQSPQGATTVVNPLASSSPIPAGSCLVTGQFPGSKLVITGNETKDMVVRVSMSTNNSFEWVDINGNGKWEPTKGENIVDMGLRGMIPFIVQ